jgi:hypothetical protein
MSASEDETAGCLFAFAAVVMPGLRSLDEGGFIRTFQVIDRVIQNDQPLFVARGHHRGTEAWPNDSTQSSKRHRSWG